MLLSQITAITLFSFEIERILLSILSAKALNELNEISSSFALIQILSAFFVALSSKREYKVVLAGISNEYSVLLNEEIRSLSSFVTTHISLMSLFASREELRMEIYP